MSYERVTWADGETALSAEHMNNIEEGIGEAKISAETQADWNQIDNTQIDFIKNKPDFVYGYCGGTETVEIPPQTYKTVHFPLPESLQGYQRGYSLIVGEITLNDYQGDDSYVFICSYTTAINDVQVRVYNPSPTVTENINFEESIVQVFGFKNVSEAE